MTTADPIALPHQLRDTPTAGAFGVVADYLEESGATQAAQSIRDALPHLDYLATKAASEYRMADHCHGVLAAIISETSIEGAAARCGALASLIHQYSGGGSNLRALTRIPYTGHANVNPRMRETNQRERAAIERRHGAVAATHHSWARFEAKIIGHMHEDDADDVVTAEDASRRNQRNHS